MPATGPGEGGRRKASRAPRFGTGTREAKGPAVVLLHAASGSGAFWGYQQPVLAKAGYRVISYSRRGYLKSDPGDPNDPGIASEDLHNLARLPRCRQVSRRRPCRGRHRRDRLRALASRAAVEPDAGLDHHGRHRQELPRSLQHLPPGVLRAAAEGFSGAQRDLSRGQSGRGRGVERAREDVDDRRALQSEECKRHHLGEGRDDQGADAADDRRFRSVDAAVDPAPAGEPPEACRGEGDRGSRSRAELGAAGGLQRGRCWTSCSVIPPDLSMASAARGKMRKPTKAAC